MRGTGGGCNVLSAEGSLGNGIEKAHLFRSFRSCMSVAPPDMKNAKVL